MAHCCEHPVHGHLTACGQPLIPETAVPVGTFMAEAWSERLRLTLCKGCGKALALLLATWLVLDHTAGPRVVVSPCVCGGVMAQVALDWAQCKMCGKGVWLEVIP